MKKNFLKLILFLCLIIIPGCQRDGITSSTPDKTKIEITTSFYPVYISTINITKDVPGVHVVNLTKPFTGCLHDYALTADNMKTMASADIFVINGAGMEAFLDKIIKEQPELKIVDASKNIELIKHEEESNPHVWLSIFYLIKQVRNIEEGLSLYDPSNKDLYKKNADIYIEKLGKLKDEINSGLKGIKDRNIITFHEAFPYFAKDFNVNILAVIEREPGSEPNARELAETIKIVKKNKVKALFAEPQYPSSSADVIAEETGIKVFRLDPAVTGPMEPDAYINIMKNNLKVLNEALK
jgi:zinc transport system substrate-binding protein